MALTEYSCIKCNVLSEPIKGSMGRDFKKGCDVCADA